MRVHKRVMASLMNKALLCRIKPFVKKNNFILDRTKIPQTMKSPQIEDLQLLIMLT
jgi:hypothetical protein